MPKISVIMGIYNCAGTLEEAVGCILAQTVQDWELVMCDDGSTDETFEVAARLQQAYPEKIKLLQNERNRGLNATLNRCLAAAAGDYIARMDGDDRCDPARFEKELSVLESEPQISIVSSDMEFFDESGVWGITTQKEYPMPGDLARGTPFCHAPCMVRKSAFDAVGGYSEGKWLLRVEDYHLWVKMYEAGLRGKNIALPLYQMRDDRSAYNRRKFRFRLNEVYVRYLAVKKLRLPVSSYVFVLRPILVGLLPQGVYDRLHKWRLKGKEKS